MMDTKLYIIISTMMFLEFAIWGAWSPVLATRLLGPLKMNGKQTGWIYGTIPLACIVAPLVAGFVADRWIATEWILMSAHLVGGILLLFASSKKTFKSLFTVMMLYSLCYAATLPLVNSLMFTELGKHYEESKVSGASANIFIWAPVAWMLAGFALTGWRRVKGTGDGSDCLKLGGILSLVMAGFCFFLPHTPPPGAGVPFVKAFELLGDRTFLVFLIISFVVTTQMWFYFLGTAQYLADLGIKPTNIPAVMTIAQIAQIIFTLLALKYALDLGFKWVLTGGVACWLIMYVLYSLKKPVGLVVGSMAFHGIAYVLFIIGGQIYVNSVASKEIISSAQALLFAVTTGFGFFLGTQFTGIVMDKFSTDGKFNWRPIFLVPCVLMTICVITFLLFFNPVK